MSENEIEDMNEQIMRIKESSVGYKEEFSPDFPRPAKYIEGFALTADFVKTSQNKRFKIVEAPYYEKVHKFGSKTEYVDKLVLIIEMDGQKVKYYPNKTSQGVLVKKKGYFLPSWVGLEGDFVVKTIMIGNTEKEALFVAT